MSRKNSITPRKQPRQERSRITVEAILEATTQVLTEKGYDKTNTNLIAERAGVSIGSLYQYFPNKKSLIIALREQHCQQMTELLASKFDNLLDTPPEQAIPQLIRAVMAVHALNPRLHQVLNEEIPRSERSKEEMKQTEERITELLTAYLTKWSDRFEIENLEMTLFILNCTVESLCHSAVIEHPNFIQDSQFEREVSNLILSYLMKNTD